MCSYLRYQVCYICICNQRAHCVTGKHVVWHILYVG